MSENIVEYIINLYKEKYPEYGEPNDNEIHDFIYGDMEEVWSGDHDKHRWYTIYKSVHKLPNDRYVKIPRLICDENHDYYDCLNFSKNNIIEVFPKQIISTIYVNEKPNPNESDLIIDQHKLSGSFTDIV